MKIVLIGLGFGLAASLASARVLSSFLFNVGPVDFVSVFGSVVIFAVAALAACCVPSRRAMRIDPMKALRKD
jgi:ABC-type antimicrobial peptide transport system permease subunit